MTIHYRSLLARDVPNLVAQVAAHPILGPLYRGAIDDFGLAVTRSLDRNYEIACAFEEVNGSRTKLLGAGLAVFVTTEFLREVKATPHLWVGPELVNRILRGANPLLSDNEVRDANSRTGLNLLVWHLTIHPNDLNRAEVGVALTNAFMANFLGFQLTEMHAQADCLEHLQGSRNAGCQYLDRVTGRYGDFPDLNHRNFGDVPHNFGIEQRSAYTLGFLWSLFCCAAPRIGFTSSEQRVLRSALLGGTDEDVSTLLRISLTAVKQHWRAIYARAAGTLPNLFIEQSTGGVPGAPRGKERRRRLLTYLREHPEELRPVSRKLLQRSLA